MMGIYAICKRGQRYLTSWPAENKLGMIFPENRIIKSTLFGQKFMPFVAVFAVAWQQVYSKGDGAALAIALLTALFALSLPLQGVYWLGKRAQTPLPAQSAVWFDKICALLQAVNETVVPPTRPTYQDLAEVLSKAQKKLPPDFWQEI